MSKQGPTQAATTNQPKPAPDGFLTWNEYWTKEHNQPWRTEPEIDDTGQQYLAERRAIQPDIEKGVYPFGGVKLNRADVEWLLATHESGGMRGPVDWSDESQRGRQGVDLRGADLHRSDLRALPLARLRGGLSFEESRRTTVWQDDAAAIHLEDCTLNETHLEGAVLKNAQLQRVSGIGTRLEHAFLEQSHWDEAYVEHAHMENAHFFRARFQGAILDRLHFEGANLLGAQFDATTAIFDARFSSPQHGTAFLLNVDWGGANLNTMNWAQLGMLAEEQMARHPDRPVLAPIPPSLHTLPRAALFENATRANRQLAAVLREQGINEWADHFAYRANVLQRQVLRRRHQYLRYGGSLLLDLISGYGYKPMRSLIAYVVIILAFTGAYLLNAQFAAPHLTWDEALVLSISAFHGRGFFTSGISLGDTLARLAAGEAIIGLLIEITFIATFTQRFFAR
ncbi:MAG TPA: pentapeptide repeat-containing protein [Ktedonobacterales bacterium]|jgi:uncharacterized protein YjbI with pentapeptide repeats